MTSWPQFASELVRNDLGGWIGGNPLSRSFQVNLGKKNLTGELLSKKTFGLNGVLKSREIIFWSQLTYSERDPLQVSYYFHARYLSYYELRNSIGMYQDSWFKRTCGWGDLMKSWQIETLNEPSALNGFQSARWTVNNRLRRMWEAYKAKLKFNRIAIHLT